MNYILNTTFYLINVDKYKYQVYMYVYFCIVNKKSNFFLSILKFV